VSCWRSFFNLLAAEVQYFFFIIGRKHFHATIARDGLPKLAAHAALFAYIPHDALYNDSNNMPPSVAEF